MRCLKFSLLSKPVNSFLDNKSFHTSDIGKDLLLNMGYSHPVKMITPTELTVKVENPTSVVVSGMQKDMVGEFAAKIRSVRPPEPYKGKGIAYDGEIIRRKAGKTGK